MTGKAKFWAIVIVSALLFLFVLWATAFLARLASADCVGKDRWSVKTLQDGFAPGHAIISSIEQESKLKLPVKWTTTLARQPIEDTVVTFGCKIIACGIERDSDFHLVLSDGKHTMIGEIPKGECSNPKYAKIFDAERAELVKAMKHYPRAIKPIAPINCTVTGVRFFDEPNHNGTGHAKNEIEAHPLLKIELQ